MHASVLAIFSGKQNHIKASPDSAPHHQHHESHGASHVSLSIPLVGFCDATRNRSTFDVETLHVVTLQKVKYFRPLANHDARIVDCNSYDMEAGVSCLPLVPFLQRRRQLI